MSKFATGAQLWPLTTSSNDNPTLTQGAPTSFFLNTVPDRCPNAPLAYTLPYVLLTISGSIIQSGTAGSIIYWDQLPGALLDSIDWINAWHGTVVSANHVKGVHLPVVEYIANGFRYGNRRRPPVIATAGTYPFSVTFAITPASSRLGNLEALTSQLACLYQASQFRINMAAAASLTAISTGATFGTLTARASAVLMPTNELILGTPVETVLEQIVAGSSSSQIQIRGFGTDTMLNGVKPKGGVAWLGELTNVNQQGGVFAASAVTQYTFPWRSQTQIYDSIGFMAMQQIQQHAEGRSQILPADIASGDSERNNYPYIASNSDRSTTAVSAAADLVGLYAWVMAQGGPELRLSNLQTADSDQSYFLTVTGGFSAGSHLILGMYAREFTDDMRTDWVRQITKGGTSSLAAYVLGGQGAVAKAQLDQLRPAGQHRLTVDNVAYLPYIFA